MSGVCEKFCLNILACICPPLAVCMSRGCCSSACFGSLCLTLLGWFPGCLYACCVVNEDNGRGEVSMKQKTIVHQPAATPANIVINMPSEHGQGPSQGFMAPPAYTPTAPANIPYPPKSGIYPHVEMQNLA